MTTRCAYVDPRTGEKCGLVENTHRHWCKCPQCAPTRHPFQPERLGEKVLVVDTALGRAVGEAVASNTKGEPLREMSRCQRCGAYHTKDCCPPAESAFQPEPDPRLKWRVGRKVPVNVYEGERPICQCHAALDAKRIVDAVNAAQPERVPNSWTQKEVRSFHELASEDQPEPSGHLIRAMSEKVEQERTFAEQLADARRLTEWERELRLKIVAFVNSELLADVSDREDDGFGGGAVQPCLECGLKLMQVVRPGKVQCGLCG